LLTNRRVLPTTPLQARELIVTSLPVHDDVMMRMLEALVQVGATHKQRRMQVNPLKCTLLILILPCGAGSLLRRAGQGSRARLRCVLPWLRMQTASKQP
jgi:hypothetical protein